MTRTVETVPDDQIIAKPAKKVEDQRGRRQSMQAQMKAKLAAEPQVDVRIREQDGSQFVSFNGYGMRIFPSENYVKVPMSVANELRNRGVI